MHEPHQALAAHTSTTNFTTQLQMMEVISSLDLYVWQSITDLLCSGPGRAGRP